LFASFAGGQLNRFAQAQPSSKHDVMRPMVFAPHNRSRFWLPQEMDERFPLKPAALSSSTPPRLTIDELVYPSI
jgi:hypothetical protein